jgi:hypothetical protein
MSGQKAYIASIAIKVVGISILAAGSIVVVGVAFGLVKDTGLLIMAGDLMRDGAFIATIGILLKE